TGRRPHRLPVHRDGLEPGRRAQLGHPLPEARRERLTVEGREHPVEGVVAGDAVGQLQEPLEPVVPGVAESLDLLETVGPADHRTEGDGEDVVEPVIPSASTARVAVYGIIAEVSSSTP